MVTNVCSSLFKCPNTARILLPVLSLIRTSKGNPLDVQTSPKIKSLFKTYLDTWEKLSNIQTSLETFGRFTQTSRGEPSNVWITPRAHLVLKGLFKHQRESLQMLRLSRMVIQASSNSSLKRLNQSLFFTMPYSEVWTKNFKHLNEDESKLILKNCTASQVHKREDTTDVCNSHLWWKSKFPLNASLQINSNKIFPKLDM